MVDEGEVDRMFSGLCDPMPVGSRPPPLQPPRIRSRPPLDEAGHRGGVPWGNAALSAGWDGAMFACLQLVTRLTRRTRRTQMVQGLVASYCEVSYC